MSGLAFSAALRLMGQRPSNIAVRHAHQKQSVSVINQLVRPAMMGRLTAYARSVGQSFNVEKTAITLQGSALDHVDLRLNQIYVPNSVYHHIFEASLWGSPFLIRWRDVYVSSAHSVLMAVTLVTYTAQMSALKIINAHVTLPITIMGVTGRQGRVLDVGIHSNLNMATGEESSVLHRA